MKRTGNYYDSLTDLDMEIIQQYEDVMFDYELWGDQVIEYIFMVLEAKYGTAKTLELFEHAITEFKLTPNPKGANIDV